MAASDPRNLVAIDIDTGRMLSDAEAIDAADNPRIHRWVRFVSPLDVPSTAPTTTART